MCGVFGVVSLDGHPLVEARAQLTRMAQALGHRGPDSTQILTSPLCALGATRLAIIDLDGKAAQPLASPCGRLWVACNGEIYNHGELRRRFPDYPYRSRSDLEPLLPLLTARGAAAPEDIEGMFALAAWDEARQRLILARDRAGEKPLFLARRGSELWFASEIGALLALPHMSRELDPVALSQYLRLGHALEPRTLFGAIERVESGCALVVSEGSIRARRYWDPATEQVPVSATRPGRVQQLRTLLRAAVNRQVEADVPLGVFTSGGLDSSLVTVLAAQALGPGGLTSFSARFSAQSYDEGAWARQCAQLAGSRHVEVACTEEALVEAFQAMQASAEPISDPAVLPTWLLARAARAQVRVVLTGEGADELFGGYPTYVGHRLAPLYGAWPAGLRRAFERALAHLPSSGRKVPLEFLLRRFVAGAELDWVARHVEWFGAGVPVAERDLGREALWLPKWADRQRENAALRGGEVLSGAMLLDYCTCLREKLLVKSDRALMLHSIEGRMPYLDRALSGFALSLPVSERMHGLSTKWLLKQAARAWLPAALIHRRKRGLSVPIADLLRGALGPESGRLLRPDSAVSAQLFDAVTLRRLLQEHQSGRFNHARLLWPALTLSAWAERWQPVLPERLASPASVREVCLAT